MHERKNESKLKNSEYEVGTHSSDGDEVSESTKFGELFTLMYSLHCTIFTKSLSYSLYAYVSTYSLNCSCWRRLKKGESLLVKHIDIFRLKNGRV